MQSLLPQKHVVVLNSSAFIQGKGLCPHSPPMPLPPSCTWPLMAIPAPHPVPIMAPKTTDLPAAAPSTASDTAKQFASLAIFTLRFNRAPRSTSRGWPLIHVELAFLTRPVKGEITPGIPMPIVAVCCKLSSTSVTSATNASTVATYSLGVGMRLRNTSLPSSSNATNSIFVPPRSIPIRNINLLHLNIFNAKRLSEARLYCLMPYTVIENCLRSKTTLAPVKVKAVYYSKQ